MELIRPAREGTLRVLRAVATAGTVSRVVVTSSAAAVAYGHEPDRYGPSKPAFTEDDWSVADNAKAYYKSKVRRHGERGKARRGGGPHSAADAGAQTLAEKAAWDFVKGEENTSGFTLAAVNPTFLLGPPLSAQAATSVDIARRLLTRCVYPLRAPVAALARRQRSTGRRFRTETCRAAPR